MNKLRTILAGLTAVALLALAPATAEAKDSDTARAAAVVQPSPNTVTSVTIKDRSIGSGDYGLKSIYGTALKDNTIPWLALGSQMRSEIRAAQGPIVGHDRILAHSVTTNEVTTDVMMSLYSADQASNVLVDKIGGPIATNGTVLADIDLPVGLDRSYLVNLSGQFDRTTAAAHPGAGTKVQLSLWWDKDNDGVFEWQNCAAGVTANCGEGLVSPNAPISDTKDRSATVQQQYVLKSGTLDGSHLKVIGFGYNDDTSAYGSGEITVKNALVTLLPLFPHS